MCFSYFSSSERTFHVCMHSTVTTGLRPLDDGKFEYEGSQDRNFDTIEAIMILVYSTLDTGILSRWLASHRRTKRRSLKLHNRCGLYISEG